jgi:NAD(P)-dependent dehydrogenase (short-subunit alcohol dehydrogenase family)
MIDMHNKTVAVTGANSGVGFVTATRLAEVGAEIVMVCRDAGRGEEARAWIAERATGPPPQLFIADLSSQEEIRDLPGTSSSLTTRSMCCSTMPAECSRSAS